MIRSALIQADGKLVQVEEDLSDQWLSDPSRYCWIDIAGESPEQEKALLLKLNCHPLAVQDVQRPRHPPKLEIFEDNVFILYRGITGAEPGLLLDHVQIALFASKHLLITCHKTRSFGIDDWWQGKTLPDMMRNPLLLASKVMLNSFGRYLEAVLDFEDNLADKEEAMQASPTDDDMRELVTYKSRIRKLRRVFLYHERLVSGLLQFVKQSRDPDYHKLKHDVQDLHERTDRIGSMLSMFYEICGDLIGGYLSITSHNLNRTMQFLTVITTIFVPLSFLAGVYGMNFDNMPELHYKYGYFLLLGVMSLMASGALIIFRLRRWL